jgi:alpha-1,6-mannosyltransferase
VMVSHESLAALLQVWGVPPALRTPIADRLNARSAGCYDQILCTTGWGAAEFRRIDVTNLVQVPLGVDLDGFDPAYYRHSVRSRYGGPDEVLVVLCSRLSPEKQPEIAIDAVRELRRAGVPAVLVVVGDGPRRTALVRRAAGLPVHFAGFLPGRSSVAALLASADVAVAPGPAETFGLAGLEALASGTPVVVNAASALPEVVGEAGRAAEGTGAAFAAAVQELLRQPEGPRRTAARARAERFSWAASVEGFLRVHAAPVPIREPAW